MLYPYYLDFLYFIWSSVTAEIKQSSILCLLNHEFTAVIFNIVWLISYCNYFNSNILLFFRNFLNIAKHLGVKCKYLNYVLSYLQYIVYMYMYLYTLSLSESWYFVDSNFTSYKTFFLCNSLLIFSHLTLASAVAEILDNMHL